LLLLTQSHATGVHPSIRIRGQRRDEEGTKAILCTSPGCLPACLPITRNTGEISFRLLGDKLGRDISFPRRISHPPFAIPRNGAAGGGWCAACFRSSQAKSRRAPRHPPLLARKKETESYSQCVPMHNACMHKTEVHLLSPFLSFFLLSSNKLSPISSQLVPNERTPPSIPTDLESRSKSTLARSLSMWPAHAVTTERGQETTGGLDVDAAHIY
jgi:hypothetical protein